MAVSNEIFVMPPESSIASIGKRVNIVEHLCPGPLLLARPKRRPLVHSINVVPQQCGRVPASSGHQGGQPVGDMDQGVAHCAGREIWVVDESWGPGASLPQGVLNVGKISFSVIV